MQYQTRRLGSLEDLSRVWYCMVPLCKNGITHVTSQGLDKATQNQLARSQRLHELLKQSQSDPLTVEEQVATIYTGTNVFLDSFEIGQVKKFLIQLRAYLKMNKPQFQEIISSTKTFTEEAETLLKEAIQEQTELFLLEEKG